MDALPGRHQAHQVERLCDRLGPLEVDDRGHGAEARRAQAERCDHDRRPAAAQELGVLAGDLDALLAVVRVGEIEFPVGAGDAGGEIARADGQTVGRHVFGERRRRPVSRKGAGPASGAERDLDAVQSGFRYRPEDALPEGRLVPGAPCEQSIDVGVARVGAPVPRVVEGAEIGREPDPAGGGHGHLLLGWGRMVQT